MTWRRAHGRARDCGRLVVDEGTPADELRAASPPDTDRCERTADGRFARGNRIAQAKRVRSGPRGSLAALEAQAEPGWQAAHKWGRRYSAHRRAELASMHGGSISAAVGAMVETAGDLLADARYWRARAMAEGSADYARLASQLATSSRQTERDSWHMAAVEAAARESVDDGDLWRTQRAFQRQLAAGDPPSPLSATVTASDDAGDPEPPADPNRAESADSARDGDPQTPPPKDPRA